nr:hypothetical protein [Nannocystis sp.]
MTGYLLWALVIVVVLLPLKYDPAFWLMEFNARWAKRIKERRERD